MNNGATWETVDSFRSTEWTSGSAQGIAVTDSGTIYVTGWAFDSSRRSSGWRWVVRTSTDGGDTWTLSDNTASLAWHRQRLNSAERAQQWFAAEFHARQLAGLAPGDPIGQADLERVLSRRPPPRDPVAPPELIDLSAFYNASLAITWRRCRSLRERTPGLFE